MSNNAPPIGLPGQQLSRSKSLNDISNDSQISAFASDRFINIHNNNNNGNNNLPAADGKDPNPTYMHVNNPYIYNQHNNNVNMIHPQIGPGNNFNNNIYGNLAFDNSRNLNNNQCSRPTNANVYNLCNPLPINLNGVTEQIGNLHL